MKPSKLRQESKRLMIENDYFDRGANKLLADELKISYQTFIMALSGYREGPKSVEVLEQLKAHLS